VLVCYSGIFLQNAEVQQNMVIVCKVDFDNLNIEGWTDIVKQEWLFPVVLEDPNEQEHCSSKERGVTQSCWYVEASCALPVLDKTCILDARVIEVRSNDAGCILPLPIANPSPWQPFELFNLSHSLLATLDLFIDHPRETIHFALVSALVLYPVPVDVTIRCIDPLP